MVEDSPKIVLSPLGLGPVPRLLQLDNRPVHSVNVATVSESGKLSITAKSILTQSCPRKIAIDLESHDRVSQSDHTTSPTLVERLVSVTKRSCS